LLKTYKLIHGRDIVLTASRRNDLYFFTKEHVLKWSHKRWHRVSGPSLESILVRYLPDSAARTLTSVLVELSSKNQGALFAIAHDPAKLVVGASPGLRQQFSGRYLFDLASVNTIAFCRLAAIDGCTVIDSEGHVVNAGVILDIPEDFMSAGEGARTAASSFASTFGLAVKVSHDGPITVFEDGVVIRQTA